MKKRQRTGPSRPQRGRPSRPERNAAELNREPAERSDPTHAGPIVFGQRPTLELMRSAPNRAKSIWVAKGSRESRLEEIISLAESANVAVERVDRGRIENELPGGANHQGVAVFGAPAHYSSIEAMLAGAVQKPLLVVLDGVEDPRNLGAVIRTAECAGADGVIVPSRRAAGLSGAVARSSAGATEYIKVAKIENLNKTLQQLKEQAIWTVGASLDAAIDYTDWDWTEPTALVLGSEGRGLRRLVAETCDVLVKIPIYGKIDSLNVSVAAGVILFEARRQRAYAELRGNEAATAELMA